MASTATKTGDLASALMAADDALQNLVAEERQLELHFRALAVKDASFRASQAQTQFTGILTWCRSPTGMDVLLHENMLKFLGPAAQDNAKKEKQNGAEGLTASSIFKWQQSHPGRFASFERVVEAYKKRRSNKCRG